MPGTRDECGDILVLHAGREAFDADAGKEREPDFRPDAGHLQQAAKQATFVFGRESVEQLRVFANDEVGQQLHFFADGRQMQERGHRRFELVAHATDFHSDLRRQLRSDATAERADHRIALSNCTRRECAWHRAMASASDASA